jgi:ribosomal protein S27AE
METPPPEATTPPVGPPERRCPRCGSTLAPEQEWCLACGAAAGTEVVETRGWRVPIYLGGGLVALAILGVILAIAALSNREEPTAGTGTPTPSPNAQGVVPSASPAITPIPTTPTTPSPAPTETATVDPLPTEDPSPTAEPSPTEDPLDPTDDGTGDTGGDTGTTDPSSTFGGWTGSDGDYTIIIESADRLSRAERVAERAEGKGLTVGILDSDDFTSLNGGYQVVFSGVYTSKSEALDNLDAVRADYPDAYVKQIRA